MNTEQWIKAKYDQLTKEERPLYAFVSLKLKHLRKLNRRYGRAYVDMLIQRSYEALCADSQENEFIGYIANGCFNMLKKAPLEGRDDYAMLLWGTHISKVLYHMQDAEIHEVIFCGIGIYLLKEEPVDFYIAQYNADICRHDSTEKDFLISHLEIYGSSYIERGLDSPDYRAMLDDAIKQGHIKMYLQPKVDLKTGTITSAEALMRWIDPTLGLLPIQEYLPILEECGQMNQIDCFIFEEACKWIDHWRHTYGTDILLSVNLSKNTFVYPFFMKEFKEIFERYDCPKSCIEIELLESIILNQVERVQEVALEIEEFGFRCSLDDFGSGYSSYNVLTNIPLHILKIDRSLLQDVTNGKERILLRHIIEAAHEIGLQVVAEGVETEDYVAYLQSLQCDYIQGFVFYRPMPADEFERRFLEQRESIRFH